MSPRSSFWLRKDHGGDANDDGYYYHYASSDSSTSSPSSTSSTSGVNSTSSSAASQSSSILDVPTPTVAGLLQSSSTPAPSGPSSLADSGTTTSPSATMDFDSYNPTSAAITSVPTFTAPAVPSGYVQLSDGTTLSPLFLHDSRNLDIQLFGAAFFLAVFIRNIILVWSYVRRIEAKDKSLFYLLLFSQLWGPVAIAAQLVPLVFSKASCTAVNAISSACAAISLSVLVSGILGIKAYRCLNRSSAVLAAIYATQLCAWVLAAFDFPRFQSSPNIAQVCNFSQDDPPRFLPAAFIFASIETEIFVVMCFAYAVWNATRRSAKFGRVSLDVGRSANLDDFEFNMDSDAQGLLQPQPPRPLRPKRSGSLKITRMLQLDVAVRNELFYASSILICHSICMIVLGIELTHKFLFLPPAAFWIGLSWSMTSLLVVQGFAGVAARARREKLLHALPPAQLSPHWAARNPPRQTPWGPAMSISTASTPVDNPFADFETNAGVWRRGSVSGMTMRQATSQLPSVPEPTLSTGSISSAYSSRRSSDASLGRRAVSASDGTG